MTTAARTNQHDSKSFNAATRTTPRLRQIVIATITALALGSTLTLAPQHVHAQAAAATIKDYDLPAQPLEAALRQIADQQKLQLIYVRTDLKNLKAPALRGKFSAMDAMNKLADGSGMTASFNGKDTIVIKPREAAKSTDGDTSKDNTANPIQLAQATSATSNNASASDTAPINLATENKKPEAVKVEKIEVTGSRVKRVEADGAVPVNVYTRADIERSGQPNLASFLGSLNEVSSYTSDASSSPNAKGFLGATVQLRGMPVGSTLLLINGRRVQSSGIANNANAFDLSLIPQAAIERVEIVPTGSSAVYGGDALAGVVNVILKKSLDGSALDLRYGTAKGTEDSGVSFATGRNFERGSFLLLGALRKTTPLQASEREFFLDADYRRFGGTDERTPRCTPGTVTSNTAANLPGLTSTVAGIPVTSPDQRLRIGDFIATADSQNLCSRSATGNGSVLIYGAESAALHAAADYRLGGSWAVFGELTYTDDRVKGNQIGHLLRNILVPATNAFNPFGVAVRVTSVLGAENGTQGFSRDTKFTRALIGARGDIAAGWDLELAAAVSRDKGSAAYLGGITDSATRTAALASSDPALALNPFASGRAASDAVLRGIYLDVPSTFEGSKELLTAIARGSLGTTTAGPIDIVMGIELGREGRKTGGSLLGDFDLSRTSRSVYAEARAPLMSGTLPDGKRFELATLTFAARNDRYSDFDGAATYQTGVEFRPSPTALLRAATATSFKPPSLLDLNPSRSAFSADLFGLTDPQRRNEPITTGEVRFGDRASPLSSEKGKTQTLGFVWEPEAAPGLRLNATAWQIKVRDLIQLPSIQFFLNNESQLPAVVIRQPSSGGVPGQVTAVLVASVNIGQIDVSGRDYEIGYVLRSALGTWRLGASATQTTKYKLQIAPSAPVENRVGKLDALTIAWAPEWKGRLSATLDRGVWSLGITGRYLGGYKDAGTSKRDLGDYWTYDLAARADLKQLAPSLVGSTVKGAAITASVINATNRLPEFASAFPFYDFTQADWRGRYASIQLSVQW
jgi:iron complex outermembrane recepter protein